MLGLHTLPFLSRRNYRNEFVHLLAWSVLAGLVEGQFASVVVARSFHGSPLLISIATATPIAALMFSLVWGMLCVGRPKIRLAVLFGLGTALGAGCIGFIPPSSSAIWFLCQMAIAQVLLAGVVTVRSAIWKSNYPRSARGQITARLQSLRFVVSVGTVMVAAALCDRDPSSYRLVFPTAAAFGIVGVLLLTRLHIRGERSELKHYRTDSQVYVRKGQVEPFSLTALLSPGHVMGQMVRILRNDRRFGRYCIAQLLTGIANLMTISLAATIITRSLRLEDRWVFWISTGLLVALPRLVMLGTLGRWGRLFDRVGVVQFRVINVVFWSVSLAFGLTASAIAVDGGEFGGTQFLLALLFFVLRAVFQGMGYAGGALAWNLGHLHFAKPAEAEIYMGIHVSLTGLRGLIAPLAGVWLWQSVGLSAWMVWCIAIGFSLGSLAVFVTMAREELRQNKSPSNDSTTGS